MINKDIPEIVNVTLILEVNGRQVPLDGIMQSLMFSSITKEENGKQVPEGNTLTEIQVITPDALVEQAMKVLQGQEENQA